MQKIIILLLVALLGFYFYTTKNKEIVVVENGNTYQIANSVTEQEVYQNNPEKLSQVVMTDLDFERDKKLLENLPYSLWSAGSPEKLTLDENGSLVIDMKLRSLIDFYLSALGEEELKIIIMRIKYSLKEQLNSGDFALALSILDSYIQYENAKEALVERYNLELNGYSLEAMKKVRQEIFGLREIHLSEDVSNAFFKKEDEYDTYMLKRMEISNSSEFSDEYKNELLMDLDASAPQWILDQNNKSNVIEKNRAIEKKMIEEGATEEDIQSYREEKFGIEIANKKKDLDEKRELWKERVDNYQNKIKDVINNDNYTVEERDIFINDLRNNYFDEKEIRRIKALDSIKFKI